MAQKLKVDLDLLSESELRELNHEIVNRLQSMALTRRHQQLMAFRVGDRVEFEADFGIIGGTVMRINHKTATIDADDGRSWRVAPSFLRKVGRPVRDVSEQLKLVE
jgi:preprotein translocase subunit YajC